MNILVLYSLPTKRARATAFGNTDDDTAIVAHAVVKALKEKNHNASLFPLGEDDLESLKTVKADLIVNLIEWTGFDNHLVKPTFDILNALHIPYTGSSYEAFSETSNKISMKKALDKHHLPTPKWQVFSDADDMPRADFAYPVILKPALEHCSIGLTLRSVVESAAEIMTKVHSLQAEFHQPVLAEEFIVGREFQVTPLEQNGEVTILPIEEVIFTSKTGYEFLTFDSKWSPESADYSSATIEIARLSPTLQESLVSISKSAFKKLGFAGYGRFDIRTKNDTVYILETNVNPNLYDPDEEGMVLSYVAAGMTFADYIEKIINAALYDFKS